MHYAVHIRPHASAACVGRMRRPHASAACVGRMRRPHASAACVGRNAADYAPTLTEYTNALPIVVIER